MKFALNGALTFGTMDGANVEMREEIGDENIFIFGLLTPEVAALKPHYNPREYYNNNADLKRVLDDRERLFQPQHHDLFQPIVSSLLEGDQYLLLADYASYIDCHKQVRESTAIRNAGRVCRL